MALLYHDTVDIQRVLPQNTFTDAGGGVPASDISDTELDVLMDETEKLVRAKLGSYYYMNITGDNALGSESQVIIGEACTWISGQKVLDILKINPVENPDENEATRTMTYGQKGWHIIKSIVKFALKGYVEGAIPLTDATAKNGKRPSIGFNNTHVPRNVKGTERY